MSERIDNLLALVLRRPSLRERRAVELHAAARRRLAEVSTGIKNGKRPAEIKTPTANELIEDVQAARNLGIAALGGEK